MLLNPTVLLRELVAGEGFFSADGATAALTVAARFFVAFSGGFRCGSGAPLAFGTAGEADDAAAVVGCSAAITASASILNGSKCRRTHMRRATFRLRRFEYGGFFSAKR